MSAQGTAEKFLYVKVTNSDYLPPSGEALTSNNSLDTVFNEHEVVAYYQSFPGAQTASLVDIYEIHLNGNPDSLKAALEDGDYVDETEMMYYSTLGSCDDVFSINDPFPFPADNDWHLDMIRAKCAWCITTGDPNVVVGVVDTEFETTHEDLSSQIISTWDTPSLPTCDHGTKVSGCVAAETNNGLGIAGIGYETKIAGYHVATDFTTCTGNPWNGVWQAYQEGKKIINISWHLSVPNSFTFTAVNEMVDNGITIILIAGNYAQDQPSGWKYKITDSYKDFANIPGVIIVSGVDENNLHGPTGYTHNQYVDICAPAINIPLVGNGNTYDVSSGTSYAAPIVAGTAALMLAANPDLSPGEIEQILKASADDIGDGSAYPGELGAGRLNAFMAVLMAKESKVAKDGKAVFFDSYNTTSSGTWEPGDGDFLTFPTNNPFRNSEGKVYIKDSLVIESGHKITIKNMKFFFLHEAKVIVKKGAKLTLDNTVFTDVHCDRGGTWKGIEVWGTDNVPQPSNFMTSANSTHGVLRVFNNSLIENATRGIIAFSGIVQGNNSQFVNNHVSAALIGDFVNVNKSYFRSCEFIIKEGWKHPNSSTQIQLDGVKNVGISGNNFRMEILPWVFTGINNAWAIFSIEASYSVVSACVGYSLTPPCPAANIVPNVFEGPFEYGIYALANNSTMSVNIRDNIFEDVEYGVQLEGVNYATIRNNTFENSSQPIQLIQCQRHRVEENTINNPSSNPGILIVHSGAPSTDVYRNHFNNAHIGIQAQGNNVGATPGEGLVFKCNDFTNTAVVDIAVTSGDIAPMQGICLNVLAPANNQFTHTPSIQADFWANDGVNAQFGPGGLQGISYFYSPDPNDDFNLEPRQGFYNVNTTNPNECSGHPDVDLSVSCPERPSSMGVVMRVALRDLVDEKAVEIRVQQDLIDGGDTEGLLAMISGNTPPGTLKNELMEVSPFLSDEVLIALINRNPPMPAGHLQQILLANSPLSQAVMDELDQITPPLPAGVKQQIDNAQTGTSAREELELEISFKLRERELAINELLRQFLHDTLLINGLDSLIAFWEQESLQPDKEELIRARVRKQDFTRAEFLIDSLETFGPANRADFISLQRILIDLEQQPDRRQALKTDTASKAEVERIADKQVNCCQEIVHARALLQMVDDTLFPVNIEPLIFGSSNKWGGHADQRSVSGDSTAFKIYPNPAADRLHIRYELPEGENYRYSIYNIMGQVMVNKRLQGDQNMETIDVGYMSPGIYLLRIENNNRVVHSEKLMIK